MIQKQTLRSERSLGPASLRPVNCHSWSCLFPKFFCQVSMGAEGSFSPFPKNRVSRGLELASPLKSFSKETWAARPCGWQRVAWLSEALSGALGGQLLQLPTRAQSLLQSHCQELISGHMSSLHCHPGTGRGCRLSLLGPLPEPHLSSQFSDPANQT